jgi:dUTP pyrophosphatase
MSMGFTKLSERATEPFSATAGAAGYDLFSAEDINIPPFGKAGVKTDLRIELPRGCYGRIASRSGMALFKHAVAVAGVIDPDFRGNLTVILFNHSPLEVLEIKLGDRIAQLICEGYKKPALVEKKILSRTERGGKGFGSTGD